MDGSLGRTLAGKPARDRSARHRLFDSVNVGRRHYQQSADALAEAGLGWLHRMITRRVPMDGFAAALHKTSNDLKPSST
jgi:glucose dehydrogenase-like enzyme